MQKILISSCLLGLPVRFNGKGYSPQSKIIQTWIRERRLIAFCPEIEGGLGVPRPAAEILGGHGAAVLEGKAEILTQQGEKVTVAFIKGAEIAVKLVREHKIRLAILKSNSPACGTDRIYDGTFQGVLREGDGVTSAALKQEGIKIFDENHLFQANQYLNQIEAKNEP